MSFGFLTESALLPAKSKPIQVDGRSLVDLKAIVYEKEQTVKQDAIGSKALTAGGIRAQRGRRENAVAEANAATARKDVFARKNAGVEDRSKGDDLERVSQSRKRKAAERTLAAKSKLYEKMAKGEVSGSEASSLVDFSRKSGADLALLEAKASRPKRRRKPRDANDVGGSGGARGADDEVDEDEDDPTSAEVTIMDEFGRDRSVPRGGELHQAYLEAKKAEAERRAKAKTEAEAYDERYSYRGNKGAGPHPPEDGGAESGADRAAWAWSSGRGRGADAGDFKTVEGQDRRTEKKMAEMLREEAGGRDDKEEKGSKILSQWEKTLSKNQKEFLKEVQEEVETSKNSHKSERVRRNDRKALLRQKQAAREAALAASASTGSPMAGAAAEGSGLRARVPIDSVFLRKDK